MECRRRCAASGRGFRRRAQVQGQRYCERPECQRERRRLWQAGKRREDSDYRANQAAAQRAWAGSHRGYWRTYRLLHPEYCARNRQQQRERDRRRRGGALAKMDASEGILPVSSGVYRLLPEAAGDLAKMDAWTVRLTLLSRAYEPAAASQPCLQREDAIGAMGPPR
jgi:hypothetical protein